MYKSHLPSEFAALNITGMVYKKSPNEYCSACPKCGGNDRFIMWIKSEATGGPLAKCIRHCGFTWWPGRNDDDWRPSAEEIAQRAKAAEDALQREIERAQKTLDEMRSARAWLEYHDRMTKNARAEWWLRGLSDQWIDWWQLGYSETFDLWRKTSGEWEKWWTSPTLTIPIWGNGWEVNNIKHRLLEVPPNGGKYQQEKSGVPASPFLCDPDRKDGHLLIAEGEIKAMVTFATIDSATIQVAGIPSVTPSADMLATFDAYDPVYICLDPDAFQVPAKGTKTPIERVAETFGSRARIIELPDKIDDLIVAGHLDKAGLRKAFKRARRL